MDNATQAGAGFSDSALATAMAVMGDPTPVVRHVSAPRRQAPRPRSFEAAASDRLSADWLGTPVNINELLKAQLPTLRARARHLARNSDYAARFIGLFTTNVIGHTGIQVQSKAANARGGADTLAQGEIESHFANWSDNFCDYMGQQSFVELQTLAAATFARDGEYIARKVYGADAGPYGFQVQMIDVDRLECGYNVDLGGNRFIRMGIEYDQVGRAAAYHISNGTTPDGYMGFNGQRYLRLPAAEVIHGYIISEVGQGRGIPPMAPSMVRMNQLAKYEQAALVHARVGASAMGFFTQSEESDNELGMDKDDNGELIFEVEPGVFRKLPRGYDFKPFDPSYPSGEFGTFVKAALRGMSAGLGVAHHSLTGDLESVNYSSGRIGVLNERVTWMALQGWMTRIFIRQVFYAWLREALIRQMIVVRGRPLSLTNEAKYQAVAFRHKRWPWVDPLKDAQAAKMLVELKVRSRSSIIRDLGEDPEETWREVAREEQIMGGLGISTATAPAATKGVVDNAQQDSDSGESGAEQA